MAGEEVISIDLHKGIRVLRKRAAQIVLLPILTSLLAYAACTYVLPAIFRAETTLLVSRAAAQGQAQYSDMLIDQQLVKTYREIARSDTVLERVIADLRLNLELSDLRKMVNVSQRGETELIQISVEYFNPIAAASIADAVANAFIHSIRQIMRVENVVVVDSARIPQLPTKPATGLIVVAIAFASCICSVSLAFLLESLDNVIRMPKDVERGLGISLLGVIPYTKSDGLVAAGNEDAVLLPRRLTRRHPQLAKASEAYRALRTNLQFGKASEGSLKILVTSALPSEGKTTILANLAIAFAQSGKSVIALDANLRAPKLHDLFQVANSSGLTEVLLRDQTIESSLYLTPRPLLKVMPAGALPPNPSELLGSTSTKLLVEFLSQQAEILLIDSPNISAYTDAAILSTFVDVVIMVVESGLPTVATGEAAVVRLQRLGATSVGAVLNKTAE